MKINEKEAEDGPFKKKFYDVDYKIVSKKSHKNSLST